MYSMAVRPNGANATRGGVGRALGCSACVVPAWTCVGDSARCGALPYNTHALYVDPNDAVAPWLDTFLVMLLFLNIFLLHSSGGVVSTARLHNRDYFNIAL